MTYTFKEFFNDVVKKNNIKVLGHHFSMRKIDGLTLIDRKGQTSLSYEINNPSVRQNFTKCHELGHFLLGHQGSFFTEVTENQLSVEEVEANYFSACLLMPDIVLLSKIFYQKLTFQEVANSLLVSTEALSIRLIDFLRYLLSEEKEQIKNIVAHYQSGNSSKIISVFARYHDFIVQDYQSYEPSPKETAIYLLDQKSFITDDDVSELAKLEFRKMITSKTIGTWAYYDRGETIFYAWDKEKLTEKEAYQKARNKYYIN
ncbi:ImmA/IrrE family metallo-endopeptidase [uncultured Streptococcus sp.]|uniref:ImmA/IrrE family metallo-endopeptidase n=1 Tax=uncultured Streptococcus sp. TaxID=83427 RepID=UPI0025E63E41|nr:ImmA/IrrE family metallo-endopeptidase [uncultured Streptococcus sp.]